MALKPKVLSPTDAWCAGKDWKWRAALLAFLVWQAARPLADEENGTIFKGITFGAHEFGHLFFGLPGNEWLAVAGGSLMQLLVPIGAAVAIGATAGDRFGVVACGSWLAASMIDLAPYIADARAQELDLVSFSPDGGGHDWHYLLAHAGRLKQDIAIAHGVKRAAVLILVVTVIVSFDLFRRMWLHREEPATS
jgi:hypothetical protein